MEPNHKDSENRYLTLTLGDELFALSIHCVREILDMTDITRIPQTPDYMRGVVNVRGGAVPVIDLRLKFGMEKGERTLNTRIVIVEIDRGDTKTAIGAVADSVKDVLDIDDDAIDPPPRMGTSITSDYLTGVGRWGERFVLILDTNKLFSTVELSDLNQPPDEA